jgi:pimeloyl-ACP methyl ester carboxylesterase
MGARASVFLPTTVTSFDLGRRSFGMLIAIVLALPIASSGAAAAVQPAAANVTASPWWKAYLAGSRKISLPDGRKINLYCEGKGEPTVVMESGLGSAAWTWHTVQDQIAKTSQVCVYDRAGYFARSTPARGARSAGAEANDLSALLRAARIKPLYVLVGHSYGGYIVRLFAYRHPKQVAGMVLVDPSSEYQNRLDHLMTASARASEVTTKEKLSRCATELHPVGDACVQRPPPPDLPPGLVPWFVRAQDAAYASTMAREFDGLDTVSSAQLVRERRRLGSIPVVVLEQDTSLIPDSAKTSEDRAAYAAFGRSWHELHLKTLSGISSNFTLRPVHGALHRIQDDNPMAVIGAVQEVVAAARRR